MSINTRCNHSIFMIFGDKNDGYAQNQKTNGGHNCRERTGDSARLSPPYRRANWGIVAFNGAPALLRGAESFALREVGPTSGNSERMVLDRINALSVEVPAPNLRADRRLLVQGRATRLNSDRRATSLTDLAGMRMLALLGDSVTTDHISPAGSIP
jgi:hypothetical protein